MDKTQVKWMDHPWKLSNRETYLAEDHEGNWTICHGCYYYHSEKFGLVREANYPVIGYVKNLASVNVRLDGIFLEDGKCIALEEIFEDFDPEKIFSEII